jgi:hypothetical protein
MELKVRVIEVSTKQVLFECPVSEVDRAYEAAVGFEALGLDVRVEQPGVSQTLAASLGVTGAPMDEFQESLHDEIEEHPGSCCFEESGDKSKLH